MSRPKYTKEEIDRMIEQYESGEINPWLVRDGSWGGLGGDQLWVRGEGYGFGKADVIERVFLGLGMFEWRRVWIDSAQSWRDLTAEEVARIEARSS